MRLIYECGLYMDVYGIYRILTPLKYPCMYLMRERWWPNEVGVQDLAWSVGYVLWGNAFFVHCLSPLRNINRYWQIV